MSQLRLQITVPSTGTWDADFGLCMCQMMACLSHPIPGFTEQVYVIHGSQGSILAQKRERAVKTAIEHGMTHVLFIDTDQTFPADTANRLLAHRRHIVACNIATKQIPSAPTARAKGKEFYGDLVYTTEFNQGLEQVWRVGTGIMLLDLNLFKRKGMEQPWFNQRWDDTLQDYVGEDWAFMEKAEAAGVKVFIDHDLSREVGHIGRFEFHHGHTRVDV